MEKQSALIISALLLAALAPASAAAGTAHSMGCGNCHLVSSGKSIYWDHVAQNIDDTPINRLCITCHSTATGPYLGTSATEAKTHSSLSIDNSYGDWTYECIACHNQHYQEQLVWQETDSAAQDLAAGVITGYAYDYDADTSTLTYSSLTYAAGWDRDRVLNKTLARRSAVIFPVKQATDQGFFITDIDETNQTITVRGNAALAYIGYSRPSDFIIIYGQYLKSAITKPDGAAVNVKLFSNDAGAYTNADGTGICQVCHTNTNYWRSDNSGTGHNAGTGCTVCHDHRKGFGPNCNSCHGNPPVIDTPSGINGLVATPVATGSTSAGAHQKHAAADGYGFACDTCHFNGMPDTPTSGNNTIQIGFNIFGMDGTNTTYYGQSLSAPYTYGGTNNTTVDTVTAGKELTCENVYCHSMGKIPALGYDLPSASPAWDGSSPDPQGDGNTCNNCHLAPPVFDRHLFHSNWGIDQCSYCHYSVTRDGTTIHDKSLHVNGQYDLMPSGTYYNYLGNPIAFTFTYTYAAGGGTCSNNTCHANVNIATTQVWTERDLYHDANITVTEGASCGTMDYSVAVVTTEDTTPPYTCDFDFDSDGSYEITDGSCSQSYSYGDPATFPNDQLYTVTWTLRDANGFSLSAPNPRTTDVLVCSAPNAPPTIAHTAVALNDGNYGARSTVTAADPDYNLYGRSGPGRIKIDWGDGNIEQFDINLTDVSSVHEYTHSYAAGSRYYIKVWIDDNGVGTVWTAGPTKSLLVTY